MPFSQAIRTCLRRYADFKGRATRAEFWWWWLGCGLVAGMMNLLQAALIASVAFEWWPGDWGFGLWALLVFAVAQVGRIVTLALILPSLAVTSRRLHDTGRSGWWQLLWWSPASMVVPRLNHVGAGSGPVPVLRTLRSPGPRRQLQSPSCLLGAPCPGPRVHRPGCCCRGYVHPGRDLALPPGTACTQSLRPGPAPIIPAGQRLQPDRLKHRAH